MRKTASRKFMGILLTVLLCIGLVPTTVFADTSSSISTLKVAGVDILSAEDNTITYEDGGTVVFDKETGTLTLTDANIPTNGSNYGINCSGGNLTIVLVGDNTITCKMAGGIMVSAANLTVTGSGNLTMTCYGAGIYASGTGKTLTLQGTGDISITSSSNGLAASNVVIQDQNNLTISAARYGIYGQTGGNGITIDNSTVSVTATGNSDYYGMFSYTNIAISGDSDVTVTSKVGSIYAKGTLTVTPGASGLVEILAGSSADDAVLYGGTYYSEATTLDSADLNTNTYAHIYPHTHSCDSWTKNEEGHWQICSDCEALFNQAEHTFGEWVTTKEATTTETGLAERTCTVCGYAETQELDMLPIPEYTLSFETNGGSEVEALVAEEGTLVDLSQYQSTKDGYDFAGWYADSDLTQQVESLTLSEDQTVYAAWEEVVVSPEDPEDTQGTAVDEPTLDEDTTSVESDETPQTGDMMNLTLWGTLLLLAAGSLLGSRRALKRR